MVLKTFKTLFFIGTALLLINCSPVEYQPVEEVEIDDNKSTEVVSPTPSPTPNTTIVIPDAPPATVLPPEPIPSTTLPPIVPPTTTLPPSPPTTTTTTLPPSPPTTTTILPPSPPTTTTTTTLPPSPPPVFQKQTFFQNQNKVDILIVDDNSISMEDLQLKMSLRFQSFTNALRDVDYHIGITTTDVSNGPFGLKGSFLPLNGAPGFILTPETPNAEKVFMNTIQRQETYRCSFKCPSNKEQPLAASIMAMQKRDIDNAGFFRDGVPLAIIILTDEDEMSDGPSKATDPSKVIATFRSIWKKSKDMKTYGIIVKPDDMECMRQRNKYPDYSEPVASTFVDKLIRKTGGLSFSVCDSDYSKSMAAIGEDVRKMLNVFHLTSIPKTGTVVVQITPFIDISYEVVGNQIRFSQPPPFNSIIDVTYEVETVP